MAWWQSAAACVLLVSLQPLLVAGAPLFPFNADVHDEATAEARGLVAIRSLPRHFGLFQIPLETPSLDQRILEAASANVHLATWTNGSFLPGPPAMAALPHVEAREAPGEPRRLQDAVLTLTRVKTAAQVLVQDSTGFGKPNAESRATGASCLFSVPSTDDFTGFPEHPDFPPNSTRIYSYTSNRESMAADCEMAEFRTESMGMTMFYGVDLLLESPQLQEPEEIETGTYREEVAGVPTGRTITRILIVGYDESPSWLNLAFANRAHLEAQAFQVVGSLAMEPFEGALRWGDETALGELPAVSAEGTFAVERAENSTYLVEGMTSTAPMALHAKGSGWAAEPLLLALAAAAAGVAALLVWLLWPLFAKLPREKLLQHPRRAKILDLVRSDPGIDRSSVARSLGLAPAIALFHISTMRRAGIVSMHRVAGRTALFPANAGYRGREMAMALLRRDAHRSVYDVLLAEPGQDQDALALRLGVTRARISQILQQLGTAGLVTARRNGRRLSFEPGSTP